jgi:hypothetical protein
LAVNVDVDFEQELEREAQETVDKGIAKAQAFKKMQDICDLQGLPYPPELAAHLEATLQLRQMLSQTNQLEDQEKAMAQQMAQQSPAGQAGAYPGTTAAPGMPGGPPMSEEQMEEASEQGAMAPPMSSGPSGAPMMDPTMADMQDGAPVEPALNRSRPEESDEMRAGAPRAAAKTASQRWAERIHQQGRDDDKHRAPTKFELGPSSVGHAHRVNPEAVQAAVTRREMYARHRGAPLVSQLVKDPDFYRMLNAGGHRGEIQADWPEIRAGGAQQSEKLLRDLCERYEDITGVAPRWD